MLGMQNQVSFQTLSVKFSKFLAQVEKDKVFFLLIIQQSCIDVLINHNMINRKNPIRVTEKITPICECRQQFAG